MEDNLGAGRILDSDDDEDLLVTKKRKRAVISDDEESEADGVGDHSEDDDAGSAEEDEDEVESEKDEQPKRKSAALFDKKGRLRKDFLENEAELSGSDEEYEDEDEHGLDRSKLHNFKKQLASVSDPLHFDADPDPDPHNLGCFLC